MYHPNFITYNEYYDSNIGAVISNMLIVPSLATLIASFRLKWTWIVIFTAFLAVVEILFLKLQIYTHFWWRTEYTSLGLIFVYFPLAKRLFKGISHPLKGFWHSLILFLCTAPILGNFHIMPIMLLNNRYYRPGWFESIGRDTTAFASIYYLCESIVIVLLVRCHWKHRWPKYLLLAVFLVLITNILKEINILHVLVWWDQWYYIISTLIILRISTTLSKRLSKGPPFFPK
jgi:hypothetical protein